MKVQYGPHNKWFPYLNKDNPVNTVREPVAVYCENHTKHPNCDRRNPLALKEGDSYK
jgi:hypothetical protein